MPPTAIVQGKTLSEWQDTWWKWFWGEEATGHPVWDQTGEQCSDNQENGVWFLMGYFELEDTASDFFNVVRDGPALCEVPANTYLAFPILNTGCSTIEPGTAYVTHL